MYFRLANAVKRAIKPYPYTCKPARAKRDEDVSQASPLIKTPDERISPPKNCVIWALVKYLAALISMDGYIVLTKKLRKGKTSNVQCERVEYSKATTE